MNGEVVASERAWWRGRVPSGCVLGGFAESSGCLIKMTGSRCVLRFEVDGQRGSDVSEAVTGGIVYVPRGCRYIAWVPVDPFLIMKLQPRGQSSKISTPRRRCVAVYTRCRGSLQRRIRGGSGYDASGEWMDVSLSRTSCQECMWVVVVGGRPGSN